MINLNPDILIVGGGVVGSVMSLILQPSPYSYLLCDDQDIGEKTQAHFDARCIALNRASQQIFTQLDLWKPLEPFANPIQTIQVSSQGQFGSATLTPTHDLPLGWVVEMHRLFAALKPRLDPNHCRMKTQLIDYDAATQTVTLQHQEKIISVQPKLIIAADGTASKLRAKAQLQANIQDYQQHALVTNIELKRAHQSLAIERFTPQGPIALLPLEGQRMALVWCMPPDEAKRVEQLSDADFLKLLQTQVGYRMGRFMRVGKKMIYPLKQTVMPIVHAQSMVFVGNAAQTLHPVAGQGLNLGLRDIATLAQCLAEHGPNRDMLEIYEARRTKDRNVIIQATDYLIQCFGHPSKIIKTLRSFGLFSFDQTQEFHSTFIRYASGLGAHPPDLACGIPLQFKDLQHEL